MRRPRGRLRPSGAALILTAFVILLRRCVEATAGHADEDPRRGHRHHKCAHSLLEVRTTTSEQDYGLFHGPQHGGSPSMSLQRRRRRLSSRLPIRIHAHYAFEGASTALTNSIETLLMPSAIERWHAALSVDRATSPLTFSRHCELSYTDFANGAPEVCASFESPTTCGGTVVPSNWLKSQRVCESCSNDG